MVKLYLRSLSKSEVIAVGGRKSYWLQSNYLSFSVVLSLQITDNLEQRCYKDLRSEMFGSVKVVLCIYRKFLSSCKEQM